VLGLQDATGGDDVFRHLVLARIIEPVSKLDSLRVLEEAGITPTSYSDGGCASLWPRTGAPGRYQSSLGYEPYDALLWRLELSRAGVVTSADRTGPISLCRLRLPVSPDCAVSGLQIGLQVSTRLIYGSLHFPCPGVCYRAAEIMSRRA
jgi:hypothetical protein